MSVIELCCVYGDVIMLNNRNSYSKFRNGGFVRGIPPYVPWMRSFPIEHDAWLMKKVNLIKCLNEIVKLAMNNYYHE